ncbi:hypothetical protein ACS0TY_021760 [Phlomoides rotata]
MEISLLKSLLENINSFLELSSYESISCELVKKHHQNIEEILKLLKQVLDAIVNTEIASVEMLQNEFAGLHQSVDELRQIFENWQPLMSKLYFVLQVESLKVKIQTHGEESLELLNSYQFLPVELIVASIEKIKHMGSEQISPILLNAIKDHEESSGVGSERLEKVADKLSLKSNQELLIEAVALERLKENSEQAEKFAEVECIDQMISLVTHMHDRLVMRTQSQICNPVPIPSDFCCPLSLELMSDPVIVASGQTYERAFIRKWIDLGLTVCPKTKQTLAHTNLIPNYTVKALIAHWCEKNNVKLPDLTKSAISDQPSSLLVNAVSVGITRVDSSGTPEQSLGSPVKSSFSSSATERQSTSPYHPRSLSEDSLAVAAINGSTLETGRVSTESSEDRSGERRLKSGDLLMISSSSLGHNRTNSAPITRNLSQETAVDGNEGESQPPAIPIPMQREPNFPSRLETRSRGQSFWRKPSSRFVPRVVSSLTVEMRAELLEVETEVKNLVENLKSSSLDVQVDATTRIRLLAKHSMDNRIIIANCGVITLLVNLLSSTDPTVQENSVTALLNLSINDNNKSAIANADAIEPLIHVLESGSPEAKENAAATLFSLSVIEENKIKIGRSGAIKPLVDLLGNGTPRGKKDASTALFNLSLNHENKPRIVQSGAVKRLVELMDPAFGMVDKAVAVLSNLSTIHEGRAAIGQEGGIPVLVEVIELGSGRGKENAAAALLQLCTNSSRFCTMVIQEGAVPPLVALSQLGTPRAREKAQQLLSYFRSHRHGK